MLKIKNFRKLFYSFLILFAVFQSCKPKYQEEVKPETQPKNNKMGIKTAQNWWQKQKTNRQNLQQKGGNIDSTFENSFVPDWTNAESRLSAKGKLQIRVPLLQKDNINLSLFVSFVDEYKEKYFGYTDLLLQAEADSSFRALYGITSTKDSTNRFNPQQNNFFRKESNFTGTDFFVIPENKRYWGKNGFTNGQYSRDTRPQLLNLPGAGCYTLIYVKSVETAAGNPNGSGSWVSQSVPCLGDIFVSGWAGQFTGTWGGSIKGDSPDLGWGSNTGGSSGVGNAPDPFEPEDELLKDEPRKIDIAQLSTRDKSIYNKMKNNEVFLKDTKGFTEKGRYKNYNVVLQSVATPLINGEKAFMVTKDSPQSNTIFIMIDPVLTAGLKDWEFAALLEHEILHAKDYAELKLVNYDFDSPLLEDASLRKAVQKYNAYEKAIKDYPSMPSLQTLIPNGDKLNTILHFAIIERAFSLGVFAELYIKDNHIDTYNSIINSNQANQKFIDFKKFIGYRGLEEYNGYITNLKKLSNAQQPITGTVFDERQIRIVIAFMYSKL